HDPQPESAARRRGQPPPDRRRRHPGRADRLRDGAQGRRGEEDQGGAGGEAEEGQEVAGSGFKVQGSGFKVRVLWFFGSRFPVPTGDGDAMQLDVVNNQNEKVGAVDVSDDVFGGRVDSHLVWESVVRANAAGRRGTHATKNRALVSGSGKKPWRQKG